MEDSNLNLIMDEDDVLVIYVEISQRLESGLNSNELESAVGSYIREKGEIIPGSIIASDILPEHINFVRICSVRKEKFNGKSLKIPSNTIKICYCVYQVCTEKPEVESLEEESEEVPASLNWPLPNAEFEGLWESLIFEEGLKDDLIGYVKTTLLYSQNRVCPHVVRWNGVVLLHGPPGTGKTSLCKALAQKLCIRLSCQYSSGQLIEINTHSLFSKWFSESAKLVLKMFTAIKQWLETEGHFVCLLIDEVESLTHARRSALNGTEPSDSIRVVNAVLTQIDQLQRFPNVLILATSNVTEAIDIAFADRADLKLFIGYPSKWGVYEILRSCIEELIRCKLILGSNVEFFEVESYKKVFYVNDLCLSQVQFRSKDLMDLAILCEGLSGRTLRKIPFLTSSKFIDKALPSVSQFLISMKEVVQSHRADSEKFFKVN